MPKGKGRKYCFGEGSLLGGTGTRDRRSSVLNRLVQVPAVRLAAFFPQIKSTLCFIVQASCFPSGKIVVLMQSIFNPGQVMSPVHQALRPPELTCIRVSFIFRELSHPHLRTMQILLPLSRIFGSFVLFPV